MSFWVTLIFPRLRIYSRNPNGSIINVRETKHVAKIKNTTLSVLAVGWGFFNDAVKLCDLRYLHYNSKFRTFHFTFPLLRHNLPSYKKMLFCSKIKSLPRTFARICWTKTKDKFLWESFLFLSKKLTKVGLETQKEDNTVFYFRMNKLTKFSSSRNSLY